MLRHTLTILLIFFTLTRVAASDVNPAPAALRVGLLPYLSTEKLLNDFAPLKFYLEKRLNRPVILVSAPSFQSFLTRAANYEYDLYLTAPHFAALAEQEYHYTRVSRVSKRLSASILVNKQGEIKQISDLKNGTVVVPTQLAIVAMLAEQLLAKNNLINGKNITIEDAHNHTNAMLAVQTGKAQAAIVGTVVFDATPLDFRKKFTVLATTPSVPSIMFMASPKLTRSDYEALRTAVLDFTAKGAGHEFFHSTGNGDMVPITDSEMKALAPYVKILKARSQVTQK